MDVRQEISALLRMEAQDTAILRLAEVLRDHLKECPHAEPPSSLPTEPCPECGVAVAFFDTRHTCASPHIEPPVPLPLEQRLVAWMQARGLERDYTPTSHDEQVLVDLSELVRAALQAARDAD